MARRRIIVHGRVQGVGFRYYIQRVAEALVVAGWTRNLPDGTVEIEAEGPDDRVEALISAARQGPSYSRVTSVDVTPLPDSATPPVGFRIKGW